MPSTFKPLQNARYLKLKQLNISRVDFCATEIGGARLGEITLN